MTTDEANAIYASPAGNDIRTQLEAIAVILEANFYYGRGQDHNVNADNYAFPVILMIEPDELGFRIDINNAGNVYDWDNVFIQFLDDKANDKEIEVGQQAEYRYATIGRMRALAKRFTHMIASGDGLVLQLNNNLVQVNCVAVYENEFNTPVAGIEINLSLRNNFPDTECYD